MLLFLSTKRTILAILFFIDGLYVLFAGLFQGAGITIFPTAYLCIAIGIACILPEILYIRKSSTAIWSKWEKTNEAQSQQKRVERALTGDLVVKKIDVKSRCATFVGSESTYRTLLTKCSCPDFKKRHVPCKHMYYLANECDLL